MHAPWRESQRLDKSGFELGVVRDFPCNFIVLYNAAKEHSLAHPYFLDSRRECGMRGRYSASKLCIIQVMYRRLYHASSAVSYHPFNSCLSHVFCNAL
jgi:hypothetical protein